MTPRTHTARSPRRALRGLAAFALALLFLPVTSEAANYFVAGRAYSATALTPGEEVPSNPLSAVPAEQVVGDGLVATVPRNLVRVRALSATDGSELGHYITRKDGGFLISFSAPAGGAQVRFVVEELATSQQLLETDSVTVAEPTGIVYLLVPEVPSEIDNDREFAPAAPAPALYTGIFTRVGKIELATSVGGSSQHLIDPTTGLANVPSSVASSLAIPAYEDAPFGGNLFLFGAFSLDLYSQPNACYKVRIYDDPTIPGSFHYMTDELWKTRYDVDFVAGTVNSNRELMGPKAVGGTAGCYQLTPIASSNSTFWSYPDLVALWRTGGLNGVHRLELEMFGLSNPSDFALINDHSEVTLRLDNVAPEVRIGSLGTASGIDFQSPRVYSPPNPTAPLPGSNDLLASLVGDLANYSNAPNTDCEIFSLQSTSTPRFLAFHLTASHASGFLRAWSFSHQRNQGPTQSVLGKRYDGTTNSMVDLPGVSVSSGESSTSGFSDRFLYLDSAQLGGVSCAYRFVIQASTRTTDGYHYLRHRSDDDFHYVQN